MSADELAAVDKPAPDVPLDSSDEYDEIRQPLYDVLSNWLDHDPAEAVEAVLALLTPVTTMGDVVTGPLYRFQQPLSANREAT